MSTPQEIYGEIESYSCPKTGGIKIVVSVPNSMWALTALYRMKLGGSVAITEWQQALPDGETPPADPDQTTFEDAPVSDEDTEVDTSGEDGEDEDEGGEVVGVGPEEGEGE